MIYITKDIDQRNNLAFWKEEPALYKTTWEGKGFFDLRSIKYIKTTLGKEFIPEPGAMVIAADGYRVEKALGAPFQRIRKGEPVAPLPEPF